MLREHLLSLDVPPRVLREDPRGRTWLPDELKAFVDVDEGGRDVLRRFVEVELELFDDADAGPDPFFAARVLQALPAPTEAVSPWRRATILALFHSLAAIAAYATAWLVAPEELLGWVERAHLWADEGLAVAGPWSLAAVVFAGCAVIVASAATRPHTPAA